ncbi:MAG TPA: secretion system protein, partial [Firmicutes bacterium]|nr:secretion system protein [Bacillota bacterium]
IIANGLRAGYSFPQAMDVVAREMEPPIAEEFNRVIRDNRLGKTMEEALKELTERNDNEDLDMIVTALLIQRQVGGNLAEILDKIENTIRERVRIKGEIKTLTAQQRMSAAIIVLLPFAVTGIIYLMNPDYIMTLFRQPLGLIMVAVALVFQSLGIFMIRKIVNIDV